MSNRKSQSSIGDQSPLLLDSTFSSQLQLDHQQTRSSSSTDLLVPESSSKPSIILSTQSEAARKLGTQQLIPKNLAISSRPKNRHHTTVVTLPVALEAQKKAQRFSHEPDLSWEDYDSDDGGSSLRRNRRNKSYRAAVDFPETETDFKQDLLQPIAEEKNNKLPSPKPGSRLGPKVSNYYELLKSICTCGCLN